VLVKDRSKFVKFHAVQALLLQIAYILIFGGVMTAFIISVLASLPATTAKTPPLIGELGGEGGWRGASINTSRAI